MAKNEHHHRETARCEDLQELERLRPGLDSMQWDRRKRRSSTNSAKWNPVLLLEMYVIVIAAVAWRGTTEASATSFSLDGNFVVANLTILQDASVTGGNIVLNSEGADNSTASRGRALYSRPVQFLEAATNSVASFQTSFSFAIAARNKSSKGDGFAFGLFPDATSCGDSGRFMGIFPNTTSNNNNANASELLSPGFNDTFVIEFDTHQDNEFSDPSDNHVGVNWNSMVSLNATDLTPSGLILVEGNITAWIDYSYPLRKLRVWMSNTSAVFNPAVDYQPVLEVGDLDLSQLVLANMYVGFAGGIGAGDNKLHTIMSWNFNSSFEGLNSTGNDTAPSSEAVSSSCHGPCISKTGMQTILGVSLGLVACLAGGFFTVFYFIRRRRQRRLCGIVHHKLNPTPRSSPLRDLKQPGINVHRGSLLSQSKQISPQIASVLSEQLSPQASLRSQHVSPRTSLSSKPINPLNPFSPRTSLSFKPAISPLGEATVKFAPGGDSPKPKHSRNLSRGLSMTRRSTFDGASLGPRRYTYRELKLATNGFKEMLGKGGFGTVFKGYLPNSKDLPSPFVAVKRVAGDSEQGEREFLAEISIIAGLKHRNLVQIHGWCHEKGELLLVYDYMENGSLDKHLYPTNPDDPVLSWDLRHKAICQVASALTYLHEEAEQRVIHRDVKSSNVLLDAKFNARLGDFGLARRCEHSTTADTTVLAGTMGYLAPEMVHTGKATTKSDVFSFGTLVLEVMCGKRALDSSRPDREALLCDWVWERFEAGRLLDTVDPRLAEYDEKNMTKDLQVGLLCLHPDTSCRPPIQYARQMLVGDLALPKLPTHRPTISFGSRRLIPMEDLLRSSLSTIATAIENENANSKSENGLTPEFEFQAPWKVNISYPPGHDIVT